MKIAVYPGSFDPVTNGHLDIIERSSKVFDKVIVTIMKNSSKSPMFSVEERLEFLRKVTKNLDNVEVDCGSGLLVNYMKQKHARIIIKGLRAVSDFEYEFQMALMNSKLNPEIETLFMTTSSKYSYLSSSVVKEVAILGGCLKELVPDEIIFDIVNKIRKTRG
ncbi:MAG: pantetheine-phosphate adenylyltransferase [Petroclostridium sp.]|jgi:pantetheine-phosphate adenylyltransferase|uniref:pantetheine-phosphate adenylyltransferase n=1 Tax=Petroclostridium xylanilyticum TaxID=1792311 RepID=UPI000B98A084|nr:pantetheine-phosphate adenylyltransferase [Petroclostridium xylanilyticum]MBZ4645261.1 pantetheine-phosphate adenylyltransferase [Clostridia bacterium]MDK2809880.1 pantetheine-phosphate adenylyltransferase [Petroclostridium sp.]